MGLVGKQTDMEHTPHTRDSTMTVYVTIKDVEILSAGMAWHGNGDWYVTAEHLADMVVAQADPLIRKPRVKLGHQDKWFGALAGSHDPNPDAIDGAPGFGSVENMRLSEEGAKLIGDLVEVPDWLAEAMASAYPTRSPEWIFDHETQGGRKYKAVLTDVALGSWRPATEDLADVTREQATAALVALLQGGPDAALASITSTEEMPMGQANPSLKPSASVSQDRIVSAFEKWAWGDVEDDDNIMGDPPPDSGEWYWAWCRDIRVDPDELIACVEGETWAVPWSTDGEVTVTFGTPTQVRETYVPLVATASATTAEARRGQTVIARNLPQPERPPKPSPEASSTSGDRRTTGSVTQASHKTPAASRPDNERTNMDDSVRTDLAAKLGLPDSASEDDVNAAAIAAAVATLKPEDGSGEGGEADQTQAAKDAAAPATAEDPILAEQAKQLAEATARIATMEAREAERDEVATATRRDGKTDALVAEGRIAPADHAHYRSLYDIDEAGVDKLCASLAAGRIPVTKGTAAAATATSSDEALYLASCARMGHTPSTPKAA